MRMNPAGRARVRALDGLPSFSYMASGGVNGLKNVNGLLIPSRQIFTYRNTAAAPQITTTGQANFFNPVIFAVPGGSMGPNGWINLNFGVYCLGSATPNYTVRALLQDSTDASPQLGDLLSAWGITGAGGFSVDTTCKVMGANSLTSHVRSAANTFSGFGQITGDQFGVLTNFRGDLDFNVVIQVYGNAGDQLTVRWANMEVQFAP